jgi:hypothetical protein
MFMTLLPYMFLLPHLYTEHDFLLLHMYTTHVQQFWLIRAVVIQPFIHFWTNCETAQNLFKNRLIQGLIWFEQSSLFCHLLNMRWADFLSYCNSSSWYVPKSGHTHQIKKLQAFLCFKSKNVKLLNVELPKIHLLQKSGKLSFRHKVQDF